jgi:hypothetical protein
LLELLLKSVRPEKYRERFDVTSAVSGNVGGRVVFEVIYRDADYRYRLSLVVSEREKCMAAVG